MIFTIQKLRAFGSARLLSTVPMVLWWSGQVNWLNVAEEGAARRVNDRSSNRPNQNHDGAAMHTVAAVEESIAIN